MDRGRGIDPSRGHQCLREIEGWPFSWVRGWFFCSRKSMLQSVVFLQKCAPFFRAAFLSLSLLTDFPELRASWTTYRNAVWVIGPFDLTSKSLRAVWRVRRKRRGLKGESELKKWIERGRVFLDLLFARFSLLIYLKTQMFADIKERVVLRLGNRPTHTGLAFLY